MTPTIPVPGKTTLFLERNVWRFLCAVFGYALLTSIFVRDAQVHLFEQNANDQHPLQGFLLKSEKGYDFFDFSPMNYDLSTNDLQENTPLDPNSNFIMTPVAASQLAMRGENRGDESLDVSIAGPDALLVRRGMFASIYSPQEAKHYPLLDNVDMRSVTTTPNNGILYSTLESGILTIHYLMQCKQPLVISMSSTQGFAPGEESAFPERNELQVSPSGNHAVVLDHGFDRLLWVVNLASGGMERLDVPEFGEGEIQFAPLFVDSQTVAFSAWAGDRGGTFLYHIDQKRYERISDAFSDEIHMSLKGKLVLTQTISVRAGNVPFGSVPFINSLSSIDRSEIISIFGESNEWMPLFQNPSDERIRFVSDAKRLFATISDDAKRLQITKIWNSMYDPYIQHENTLRIITLEEEGLHEEPGVAYATDQEHPFFVWNDSAVLFQALHIPDNIIDAYAHEQSKKKAASSPYALIDVR